MEILSYPVPPVEGYFNAGIPHSSEIGRHLVKIPHCQICTRSKQYVSRILVVPANFRCETVPEKACINSDVCSSRCLPFKVYIAH